MKVLLLIFFLIPQFIFSQSQIEGFYDYKIGMDISEIDRSSLGFSEIKSDTTCAGITKSFYLDVCQNKYLKKDAKMIGEYLIKDVVLTFYQNKLTCIWFKPTDINFFQLFLKKYPATETKIDSSIYEDEKIKYYDYKWINSEKKIVGRFIFSELQKKNVGTKFDFKTSISIAKEGVNLMIKNCIEEFKTRKKKECEAELLKKF